VTPDVLTQTYDINGVTPTGKLDNTQAVAEFQGQYMSDKDLAAFFKKYVKGYKVGSDDVVEKFVGDQDKQEGQTEASLDIQYIMGVSVGLKTEFWLYNSQDFCGDLANWTQKILSDPSPPFVHSVSYGWQGDLSALQCSDAKVKVVDDNFAKLAAKGISIIFASGDSGSGYTPNQNQCFKHEMDKELTGTSKKSITSNGEMECCQQATGSAGWSFVPGGGPPPPPRCFAQPGLGFSGEIDSNTTASDAQACCDLAAKKPPMSIRGTTFVPSSDENGDGLCTLYKTITGIKRNQPKGTTSGFIQPPAPQAGQCTILSSVTGSKPTKGAASGTVPKAKVVLWPSWPASSGWITAVGATRFVGQKVGNEQMATDQFGSGGGFSRMFNISTDATWQAAAVAAYLKAAPQLPPADSFPAGGRGTPDVSALGEGYEVLQNGRTEPVGGTSASTPAFSGMIGLINDARIQAGKKQMGFLNPWIYKNTDAFTDITKGNNAIGRGQFTLPYGFNCTQGWDPITGVGTPVFSKLLKAAMN
jgi:subtilase family serine protease